MKKGPAIASAFLAFFLLCPLLASAAGTPGLSPVISSISPDTNAAGTFTVKITGNNFKSVRALGPISTSTGTAVRGTSYVVNSSTQITAIVTLAAGTYFIKVTTNYGTATSPDLVVSPLPSTISSISPIPVVTGTSEVATTGSNFTAVKAVALADGSGNLIANPTYITASESSNKSPTQPLNNSPPAISGISPTTNLAGAFNVLISGSNFANVQAVGVYDAVSGNAVANATYKVKSANKFTASVNLPAGSFYFRVTTGNGASNNSPILLVSSPPPTISSISPTTGVAGTFNVAISGNNFTNVQAVKAISASTGSQVADTYVVNSPNQITATANLSADTYYLQVSTTSGTANSPNLVVSSPPPTISSISPTTSVAGTVNVAISGNNFTNVQAVKAISASTGSQVADTYVVNSPNQITATANLPADTYYLQVSTTSGTANSPNLVVNPPPPTISSISPTTGVAGTLNVAISGNNFTNVQAVKAISASTGSQVADTYVVNSPNQITATANLPADTYYLQVSTTSGTAKSPNLVVSSPPPTISSISPTTSVAGTVNVAISGNNFTNVQAVKAISASTGSQVADTYVVNSPNQITATANLPADTYYLQVSTTSGTAKSPNLVVSSPPPTISSISPTTGVAGTLNVAISGNNFTNVQAVKAISTSTGNAVGNSYVVSSSSQITATANLSADTYYLQVSTTSGTANSPNLVVSSPAPPPPPPPPPPGTTSYKLNSTIPAIVNDGTVSQGVSTSGYRTMWRGPNNNVHLLACFGGDGNSGWFGHYINMNTGAHKMITGPSKGAAMWWTYNPAADRVYIATSYAQYNESLWEFNAADQSLVMVSPTADHYSSLNLITGDDNRVYWATQWNQLFSYDHATGTFKNYGTVLPGLQSGSNYFSLAADTGYVYCGVLKSDGTKTLAISPTTGTPNFTEWEFGNAGDTGVSISTKLGTHEWICGRQPGRWLL